MYVNRTDFYRTLSLKNVDIQFRVSKLDYIQNNTNFPLCDICVFRNSLNTTIWSMDYFTFSFFLRYVVIVFVHNSAKYFKFTEIYTPFNVVKTSNNVENCCCDRRNLNFQNFRHCVI